MSDGPCDTSDFKDPLHEEAEALRQWMKEHPVEKKESMCHEVKLTDEQIKFLRENGHGELLDNYFSHLYKYRRMKKFERFLETYATAGCLTCGCFVPSIIVFILVIVGAWRMIFGD